MKKAFDELDGLDDGAMFSPTDDTVGVNNDRSPIVGSLKDGFEGITESFTYMDKKAELESMTKGIAVSAIGMDSVSNISALKDRFSDEVAGAAKELKTSFKPIASAIQSMLPKDGVLGGINTKIGSFFAEDQPQRMMSESEILEAKVSDQVARLGLFESKSNSMEARASELVRFEQIKDQTQLNSITAHGISSLDSFNLNMTSEFYRKSIELMYKQMFLTQDIKNVLSSGLNTLVKELDVVAHNTGLPDFVKLKSSEAIEANLKNKAIDNLTSGLLGEGGWLSNLQKNLSKKVTGTKDQLVELFDVVGGGIEMGGGDIDGVSKSNQAGGLIGDALINKLKGKLVDKLGTNRKFKTFSDKARLATSSMPDWLESIEEGNKGNYKGKTAGMLKRLVSDPDRLTSTTVASLDMSGPALFDGDVKTSIVSRIPGLLAQILGVLSDSGNKVDTTKEYNYDTKTFEGGAEADLRFGDVIKASLKKNETSGHIDRLIRGLLSSNSEIKLTSTEEQGLRIAIFNYVASGRSLHPTYLEKNGFFNVFSEELASKVRVLFGGQSYDSVENTLTGLSRIRGTLKDPTELLLSQKSDHVKGELAKSGIVVIDPDTGDTTIDIEKYNALASGHISDSINEIQVKIPDDTTTVSSPSPSFNKSDGLNATSDIKKSFVSVGEDLQSKFKDLPTKEEIISGLGADKVSMPENINHDALELRDKLSGVVSNSLGSAKELITNNKTINDVKLQGFDARLSDALDGIMKKLDNVELDPKAETLKVKLNSEISKSGRLNAIVNSVFGLKSKVGNDVGLSARISKLLKVSETKLKTRFDSDGDGDRDGNWKERLDAWKIPSVVKAKVGPGVDKVKASVGSGLTKILTGGLGMLGGVLGGMAGSLKGLLTVGGLTTGLLGGLFKIPAKLLLGGVGAIGGGVGKAVLAGAMGLPSVLKLNFSSITNAIVKPFKILAKPFKMLSGLFGGSAVSKGTSGLLGKGLAKGIGKRLPGIGLLLGMWAAIDKLKGGDPLGAGLEFISGLLSSVPGLGTAGSVLMDGYIAMRGDAPETKTKFTDTDKYNEMYSDSIRAIDLDIFKLESRLNTINPGQGSKMAATQGAIDRLKEKRSGLVAEAEDDYKGLKSKNDATSSQTETPKGDLDSIDKIDTEIRMVENVLSHTKDNKNKPSHLASLEALKLKRAGIVKKEERVKANTAAKLADIKTAQQNKIRDLAIEKSTLIGSISDATTTEDKAEIDKKVEDVSKVISAEVDTLRDMNTSGYSLASDVGVTPLKTVKVELPKSGLTKNTNRITTNVDSQLADGGVLRGEVRTIAKIIRIVESKNNYAVAGVVPGENFVSFGAYQFTERFGGVRALLKLMIKNGAPNKEAIGRIISRMDSKGYYQGQRSELISFLNSIGNTQHSKRAQDELFFKEYYSKAVAKLTKKKYKNPLVLMHTTDHFVNAGAGGGARMISIMSDDTMQAAVTARLTMYKNMRGWSKYGNGWASRVRTVSELAKKSLVGDLGESSIDIGYTEDFATNTSTSQNNSISEVDGASGPVGIIKATVQSIMSFFGVSNTVNTKPTVTQSSSPSGVISATAGDGTVMGDADGSKLKSFISILKSTVGHPYKWGEHSLVTGADCSGLVYSALNAAGYKIGRTTASGYLSSDKGLLITALKDVKVGDSLFFRNKGGRIHHIATVTAFSANGLPIITHAKGKKYGTLTEELSQHYQREFAGGKRWFGVPNEVNQQIADDNAVADVGLSDDGTNTLTTKSNLVGDGAVLSVPKSDALSGGVLASNPRGVEASSIPNVGYAPKDTITSTVAPLKPSMQQKTTVVRSNTIEDEALSSPNLEIMVDSIHSTLLDTLQVQRTQLELLRAIDKNTKNKDVANTKTVKKKKTPNKRPSRVSGIEVIGQSSPVIGLSRG